MAIPIKILESPDLDYQQMEVYEAVIKKIRRICEERRIDIVQALIEVLIANDIITHQNFFEKDDEAIGTKDVIKMWAEMYGENRVPTNVTLRRLAEKYGLGVKVGGAYQHSKKKWQRFLQTRCDYK